MRPTLACAASFVAALPSSSLLLAAVAIAAGAPSGVVGGCGAPSRENGQLLQPKDFVVRGGDRGAGASLSADEIDGPPRPPPESSTGKTAVDAEAGSDLLVGVDRTSTSVDSSEDASLPSDVAAADRTADRDAQRSAKADTARPRSGATSAPGGANESRARRGTWVIDSLVGQINGRPIFADEFLDPISDRLRQIVEEMDRAQSRKAILTIVGQRFEEWVNNELIIAEAESLLSPEQKQGVLAFLKDFQENEIVRRGGTRSSAEESLSEQTGQTLEEFMKTTRNQALAADLLRKRVRPRAIVSWRDIERAFQREQARINPGASVQIGRLGLVTQADAAKIEQVKARLAAGGTFEEVLRELDLEYDNEWPKEFKLGPEGMEGLPFADDIRAKLKDLKVGQATEPITQGRRTVWYGLLGRDEPPPRTIFDPEVQIGIRQELQAIRDTEERERYIASLRERWIAENIDEMRVRLIDIALKRYWR
ncbi:MAG: hypothetical protein U0575_04285 [Phycisphaerales bacterium]